MDEIKAARDAYIKGFGELANRPEWFKGAGCGWDDAGAPQLVVNVADDADVEKALLHAMNHDVTASMRVCVVGEICAL